MLCSPKTSSWCGGQPEPGVLSAGKQLGAQLIPSRPGAWGVQVNRLKEEINETGQLFTTANNMRGAVFVYVLLQMASHTIVPQADTLEGPYKGAWLLARA